jgi:hypothetical protein
MSLGEIGLDLSEVQVGGYRKDGERHSWRGNEHIDANENADQRREKSGRTQPK